MKIFRFKKIKTSFLDGLIEMSKSNFCLKIEKKGTLDVNRIQSIFLSRFFFYFFFRFQNLLEGQTIPMRHVNLGQLKKKKKISEKRKEKNWFNLHFPYKIRVFFKLKKKILKIFMKKEKPSKNSGNLSFRTVRNFLFRYHEVRLVLSEKAENTRKTKKRN